LTDFKEYLKSIGRAAIKGGKLAGSKVADGYGKIDPDVMRHLAQVPLLSYSLLVSGQEEIAPGKPDGFAPIVFVHGLGGNRGNFLLMAWYLRLHGRKRSYRIHFKGGQSLHEMANTLARFVRSVKKATGEKQVEIVAHSLGGIVARLAITEHRIARSVKTLITLGTPHHGTYPARYASTNATLDMRPDSELIKALNEKTMPSSVRVVTFFSRNDLFVLPWNSAVVEGAEQVDMTPFTHYSYLIDPGSWAAVAASLKQPFENRETNL